MLKKNYCCQRQITFFKRCLTNYLSFADFSSRTRYCSEAHARGHFLAELAEFSCGLKLNLDNALTFYMIILEGRGVVWSKVYKQITVA